MDGRRGGGILVAALVALFFGGGLAAWFVFGQSYLDDRADARDERIERRAMELVRGNSPLGNRDSSWADTAYANYDFPLLNYFDQADLNGDGLVHSAEFFAADDEFWRDVERLTFTVRSASVLDRRDGLIFVEVVFDAEKINREGSGSCRTERRDGKRMSLALIDIDGKLLIKSEDDNSAQYECITPD